jgi:apolipoprotein N-acyltransferase
MSTAASHIADTRSDRFAPFLSKPVGWGLCTAVSAVCYLVAIRFIDLWPFALFAPMPLLAASFAAPSRLRATFCAFVPIFIGSFGLWSAESFFLTLRAFVAVGVVSAIVVSGLVLVARAAGRQWTKAATALVFPTLYAALNFAFSRTAYDGTWANPAYRMDGLLPLLQIASVTGISGIVFAMTLPASGIALAWYRAESGKPWRTAAAVPLAIFGGLLLLGYSRLTMAPYTPSMRVAMIASDHESAYSRTTDQSKASDLLAFYAREVPKAAARGAQVVVLPEKIVAVTAEDRLVLTQLLSGAASLSHVWLIAGVNEIDRTPKINAAWVFSADGALVGEYHKHYFVRDFEDGYQAGDHIYVAHTPWGKTGVAICKDLDYPWFMRGYGAADVRLMLVPAWDWEGPNAVIHERMALVRGVENGFALARSAKTGFVSAHDAFGRTLASNSTFAEDPAMVVTMYPWAREPRLTPVSVTGSDGSALPPRSEFWRYSSSAARPKIPTSKL